MEFDWKDIYKDFLDAKNARLPEKYFQNKIEGVFKYYLQWLGDIVAEETIHIGSANSIRPDFVLYQDGAPQVVIEAKEPNHVQSERNREQLFSYMRQKKVDFGLYIGERIQLYYDDPKDKMDPILVFSLNYEPDSTHGQTFVNLFNAPSFSTKQLRDYCAEQLTIRKGRKKLDEEINMLFSEQGKDKLVDIIIDHLIAKGYEKDLVESARKVIYQKLNPTHRTVVLREATGNITRTSSNNTYSPHTKRPQFSINGILPYTKNGCALELVKLYLKANPTKTYKELETLFNHYVYRWICTTEEITQKRANSYDRHGDYRWHKNAPLVSGDGIEFMVTTQIDNIRFEAIVELAKRLGYTISEI